MNLKTTRSTFLGLLCISFMLFSAFPVFGQGVSAKAVGAIQFEEATIDYGTVAYNSNKEKTFSFINTGEAPVIITDVKTSCGCTVAKKPNKPIMPGETSKITVSYDTKRVGGFSKRITVTSNAAQSKQVLTIKGKVLPKDAIK